VAVACPGWLRRRTDAGRPSSTGGGPQPRRGRGLPGLAAPVDRRRWALLHGLGPNPAVAVGSRADFGPFGPNRRRPGPRQSPSATRIAVDRAHSSTDGASFSTRRYRLPVRLERETGPEHALGRTRL